MKTLFFRFTVRLVLHFVNQGKRILADVFGILTGESQRRWQSSQRTWTNPTENTLTHRSEESSESSLVAATSLV